MPTRSAQYAALVVAVLLGFVFVLPAAAELSPAELNTALIKAREETREALLSGIKDARDKTDKEFDAVKADLPKAWKGGVDKAIQAFASKFSLHRIAILDKLKDKPSHVAPVATALQDYSDTVAATLKEAAETLDTQAKEFAKTFDAAATGAKDKALKKFDELAAEIPKKLDAEAAGKALAAVQKANTTTSAGQQLADAKAAIEKIAQDAEIDTYNELRKQTGFSRIVRCLYSDASPQLACAPDILISGAEISDIVISGLPADKVVTVSALIAGESISTSAISDCVETSAGRDVSCDEIKLAAGAGGSAFVSIYKSRALFPRYGGGIGTMNRATDQLRGKAGAEADDSSEEKEGSFHSTKLIEGRKSKISLLATGGAAQVLVRVQVGDGNGDGQLATASIPIGYARFSVETGGFFGVTKLSDAALVQEPDGTGKVKVLRIDKGNDYSQETGIALGFVPRNYPSWSMQVGFATTDSSPVSAFFGPGFRLRTFGQRGLASFSSGVVLKSVKRFPGISEGMSYDATSPLLNGRTSYKLGGYVMLQLGFAFGPIPGPDNGNGEAPR